MKRALIAIVAALPLVGCAPEFNPPPGYQGGFLWNNDKSRTVTVGQGDTLAVIARRYDVPARAIIARNGLQPPFELKVGQEIILDPSRTHRVQSGDTLSRLARDYGVEMRLIAEANDIAAPYVIKVGQELWIPDPFSVAAAPIAAMPPMATPEFRSSIARQDLAPPPGAIVAPEGVAPPQPLPPPGALPLDQPYRVTPGEAQPPVATAPVAPAPVPLTPNEGPPPLTAPAPRAAARFIWPLMPGASGNVIAGFGPAGKGLHNDGINIAVAEGSQVRAADNGVVAYSGNELKGFGNLLLIKHADGWTTAYAHNATLLVKRGEPVKQGQAIATVGRTGNVPSPQLHFEIRKGTQAVDPLIHLERPNS